MERFLEKEGSEWAICPYCVERPIEHGKTWRGCEKWHICFLHNGGYWFFANTEEEDKMSREQLSAKYKSGNERRVEVTFEEMREIAFLRLKREFDMI